MVPEAGSMIGRWLISLGFAALVSAAVAEGRNPGLRVDGRTAGTCRD